MYQQAVKPYNYPCFNNHSSFVSELYLCNMPSPWHMDARAPKKFIGHLRAFLASQQKCNCPRLQSCCRRHARSATPLSSGTMRHAGLQDATLSASSAEGFARPVVLLKICRKFLPSGHARTDFGVRPPLDADYGGKPLAPCVS